VVRHIANRSKVLKPLDRFFPLFDAVLLEAWDQVACSLYQPAAIAIESQRQVADRRTDLVHHRQFVLNGDGTDFAFEDCSVEFFK
jgi:hypothetical protein